ncbi:MAG: glycine cleavage system aminomethyltransferase GcvT, partial [Parachlamydiaceae bacterium]|nr:glycine cleavage system aminomethyltransferase GcvT [Parachlamydiaceae bacterium]
MKTALYAEHLALGAKMVDFGGWEMPIQYKGIIHEHLVVRQNVGIFDVSHMGRIIIEGNDAECLLNNLSTNVINKFDGSATYTVWCDLDGMCVDDLIVYKENSHHFFIVVNAGNRQKDLMHLKQQAMGWDVTITDTYEDGGILAIQGPLAAKLIFSLFPQASSLKHMHFISSSYEGQEILIARTGYTGEEGFEIYASNAATVNLWNLLLKEGQKYQIEPIGLGARDTLRLEMGYALYGHEISATIAPTESVSAWTVKLSQHDFLGKPKLQSLEMLSTKRHAYGIILQDKGIAREGCEVFNLGTLIGKVTSGTFSPSLNQAIAIVLVEKNLQEGDSVDVK